MLASHCRQVGHGGWQARRHFPPACRAALELGGAALAPTAAGPDRRCTDGSLSSQVHPGLGAQGAVGILEGAPAGRPGQRSALSMPRPWCRCACPLSAHHPVPLCCWQAGLIRPQRRLNHRTTLHISQLPLPASNSSDWPAPCVVSAHGAARGGGGRGGSAPLQPLALTAPASPAPPHPPPLPREPPGIFGFYFYDVSAGAGWCRRRRPPPPPHCGGWQIARRSRSAR